MLYFLFIILFTILLILNLRLTKSALSPPVLFVAVWLISLIGLFLSGDSLFRISWPTLMIYFVGAIAFSFGAILGQPLRRDSPRIISNKINLLESSKEFRFLFMDLLLLILLVGLPVYWQQVVEQFGGVSDLTLALVRAQDVEQSGVARSFDLIRNLPVLSIFLASAMYYENDETISRRWRSYLAIALAIVYGSMLGTKMAAVGVLITIFFIASIRANKLRVRMALAVLLFVLAFFSAGLVWVNFAYRDISSSFELFEDIFKGIQNYSLGSLVAFEQIVKDPRAMESTQSLSRFFLETANSLGANYYVPILHADYTDISTTQHTNVYTIYFSYYKDFGLGITALLMCGVGLLCGYIYQWARSGLPIPVLFYAMMAVAIILSTHAEHFINGLNGYIKAAVVFVLIYKVIPPLGLRIFRAF